MPHYPISAPPNTSLMPVRTLEQMARLLAESQRLTGSARRVFVVAGADRLRYRVHWHGCGCRVERLDACGNTLNEIDLPGDSFLDHSLVEALGNGQLFTPQTTH